MKFNLFKNTVQQATPDQEAKFWSGVLGGLAMGEYSELILKMVVAPILDELKKVEFVSDPAYERETREVVNFLNTKYTTIYKYFFKKGFCAVKVGESIKFDDLCSVKKGNDYEFELSNPISSSTFEFDLFRKSQSQLLESIFENVNTSLTAQKAVTRILGQFTFFSKEAQKDNERVMPLTDVERKKYNDKFNTLMTGNNVGAAVEFTNASLKRDTILFPIEKLQIVDNVTFCILVVAGVLNVPYDLIPITGKSTYSNQEAAIEYLRTHTVSGIAENMLELGRKIMKSKNPMIPNKALNFIIPTTININNQSPTL